MISGNLEHTLARDRTRSGRPTKSTACMPKYSHRPAAAAKQTDLLSAAANETEPRTTIAANRGRDRITVRLTRCGFMLPQSASHESGTGRARPARCWLQLEAADVAPMAVVAVRAFDRAAIACDRQCKRTHTRSAAIASISIRNSGSASPATTTKVLAGKWPSICLTEIARSSLRNRGSVT